MIPPTGVVRLWASRLKTPIGGLRILAGLRGLCSLSFPRDDASAGSPLERRFGRIEIEEVPAIPGVTALLEAYFEGDLLALDRIEVDVGGTDFQRTVWRRLRAIPPGSTIAYGALARAIGRPSATRAVAMANARNPVPIVVPCHRVIAANGSLWGYGGGIDRKRWLLRHEGALNALL